MYYVSTDKNSIVEYNTQVTTGEGYNGTTIKWADILEHQNGFDFAIIKHDNYDCGLTLVNELPTDWYPNEEDV